MQQLDFRRANELEFRMMALFDCWDLFIPSEKKVGERLQVSWHSYFERIRIFNKQLSFLSMLSSLMREREHYSDAKH